MTNLTCCKLRKNFRTPNIGLSRLQNFVVEFVTAFLKVPREKNGHDNKQRYGHW